MTQLQRAHHIFAPPIRERTAELSTDATPPSADTDGIPVPTERYRRKRVHLLAAKRVSAGPATFRILVFGWTSQSYTFDGETYTPIANSGKWTEIFDTDTQSEADDFTRGFLLEGAGDFERLAAQVIDNGGGADPELDIDFAFGGYE